MTRLVIEIVGHHARAEMAHALAAEVSADQTWIDEGYLGEWRNHLRAWKHAALSDATHAVVLQDDAVPVHGFRDAVSEAVEQRPDDMISLYVGTHRPRKEEVIRAVSEADSQGSSWMAADTLMWGVGVVVPVPRIKEMLAAVTDSKLPYDQRIGLWKQREHQKVYYTWPSLVDHADTDTVAHAGMKQGIRVAHRVGIPEWNNKVTWIAKPGEGHMLASNRDLL